MANPVPVTYNAAASPVAGGRFVWPTWRRAMAPATWAEIGTNTLADVNPANDPALNPNYPGMAPWHGQGGQEMVIAAWCGGAWCDVKKRLYITGGGHADYAGNELYWWDGGSATFVRATNPTGAIGNTGTLNDGQDASARYFDGQPRSFHTYGNMVVADGVLWSPGGSVYFGGQAASRPFYFDESQNLWVMDTDTAGLVGYGSACYDSLRGELYGFGVSVSPPKKYNVAAKTHLPHTKGWSAGGNNVSLYDAVRDCVMVVRDNFSIQCIDAAGVQNTINLQTTALPSGINQAAWGHYGFQYDTRRDRYVMWPGGNVVYTLTPPSGDFRTEPWVWGQIELAPENVTLPTAMTQRGTWGRFWYSRRLDCVGVVNATNQKMYVLALEAA